MKSLAVCLLFTSIVVAKPSGQVSNPYLTVKVSHAGSSYETDVSKQQVHNKLVNEQGEYEEIEPFQDHVPPFLAFAPLKQYESQAYNRPEIQPAPKPSPYRAEARLDLPDPEREAGYPLEEEEK